MATSVYSVTLENADKITELLRRNLCNGAVYFRSSDLGDGSSSTLRSGDAVITVENSKSVVIEIKYQFVEDRQKVVRSYLLPILQPLISRFKISTVSILENELILVNSYVTSSYDLLSRYELDNGFLPRNLSMCEFVLNKSLLFG